MLKFLFLFLFSFIYLFNNKFWKLMMIFIIIFFFFFMNMIPSFYMSSLMNFFFMDYLSYGMILLSLWVCYLMIMASSKIFNKNNYYNMFLLMVLFLMILLFLTFSVSNFFMFYLFFESSLIPTLLLILGWGYQPERIQAGLYLLFYTLFASLPLLMGIFYLFNSLNLMNFLMFNFLLNYHFIYLCLVLAFLVKMPMFMVHLWLPKAHVEAPISGSMILAGVLLKLGGYGLLRVYKILFLMNLNYNFLWVSLSLFGGIMISLLCLRQIDMKLLIAYSSVAHMGLVLSGFMTLSYWGVNGCYFMMIAHGLCSSGLFCLANISYERMGSRSLLVNKGLMNFMPSLSLWWFLLCSSNMSAPPSLNLLGEISLINSLMAWSWLSMMLLILFSFFSASYSLYLFAFSQHGMLYSSIYSYSNNNLREFLLLFLHWLPLNLLIMKSNLILI